MRSPTSSLLGEFLGKYISYFLLLAQQAVIVMFVAAAVAKQTTVFAPIGYAESLAWAAGYGLVRGLFHKGKDE